MDTKYSFRNYLEKATIPLYKYYKNLQYAQDAIVNKRIHLEAPCEYNDIYDSAFIMNADTLRSMKVRSLFLGDRAKQIIDPAYHYLIDEYTEKANRGICNASEFVEYICNSIENVDKSEFINELIVGLTGSKLIQADNNKISCFSERPDSILLWAYYASNCAGVCLGFDMRKDDNLAKHCHKVHYSRYLSTGAQIYANYFRKSDEWAHEQEWRIVCDTKESYLSTTAISSVILGTRIPAQSRVQFIELAIKSNLDVYTIVPSQSEFKLEILPL